MSTSPSPQRSDSLAGRLKFRNPARSFTLNARPASPSATGPGGRPVPARSSTRDSSTPPPTTRSRSSIIPTAFQRRASTKASSSKAPSSEAVNELGAKTTEPSTSTEQAPTEAPKDDTSADVSGHARALSGSTVETEPPMTPPPTQTAEPMSIRKSEDPVSDSPHDGASIASSRSASRLRRQVSNLSRHSVSGSIRRLSLLGPASPPQAEAAPIHAQGEMGEIQKTPSRSPSISSLRRHAASPDPIDATSTPEPASEVEGPQPVPQPTSESAPAPEPEDVQPAVPQTEALPTVTEAPKSETQPEVRPQVQPTAISTPPKEATPAPSVKAPSAEVSAPKPAEPQTPVKPLMSRSASKSSLARSPTPDKPEPKRRGTLANWARKSIDRRSSVSGSPAPSTSGLNRPASRGPVDDEISDTESVKERERKWGTGLPVPNPPTPKKSEDNIKRRFSLGRRQSESTKSPNESSSDVEKKSNWGSKMLRAVSKTKKEKEKGDASSITPEQSSVDVATEPAESRPSVVIPDRTYEQRPLSAIVESPAVALNPHMLVGPAQSPEQVMGAPIPAVSTDSPVVVQAETTSPEMSPVMVTLDSETSGIESGAENMPALATVAAEVTTEFAVVEEPEPVAEVEQPKDASPVEEAKEGPAVVGEVAAPEASTSTPPAKTTGTSTPPENLMSPMSPNSPASTPWDPTIEREISHARSPRQSNGGPSTSNRPSSPAPSIIGVKRKHPDEPTEVGKSRVRYLPDWAVSPAIQLAVTLSIVLPRRKRDVANPSNRKRSGWWPLRRGTRTDVTRTNAIRGVNEEVPVVSKSWVVPAAVRTTAKVVTAPARWMFHFFVPRPTRA